MEDMTTYNEETAGLARLPCLPLPFRPLIYSGTTQTGRDAAGDPTYTDMYEKDFEEMTEDERVTVAAYVISLVNLCRRALLSVPLGVLDYVSEGERYNVLSGDTGGYQYAAGLYRSTLMGEGNREAAGLHAERIARQMRLQLSGRSSAVYDGDPVAPLLADDLADFVYEAGGVYTSTLVMSLVTLKAAQAQVKVAGSLHDRLPGKGEDGSRPASALFIHEAQEAYGTARDNVDDAYAASGRDATFKAAEALNAAVKALNVACDAKRFAHEATPFRLP